MGAAASIEAMKPVDASDIRNSGDLAYARGEIVQLRASLGKYALQAGFQELVVYDASDLCRGIDEAEDFENCIAEIAHIRQCLRLSTQGARRKTRSAITNMGDEPLNLQSYKVEGKFDSDSDSTSEDEKEAK